MKMVKLKIFDQTAMGVPKDMMETEMNKWLEENKLKREDIDLTFQLAKDGSLTIIIIYGD